ncbi:MFS transporter [Paraburkholderia sp. NMBU_R16]|uniref:MFS transporter n=1 Tax=Paraburkholderia sp. NMBU_R16 TaxID=2698676 RepID=UPI00156314EE|nr:MFS transporter [Paraburkholderia sp. NMBU_R16]NRO95061.1 MFS transporter [Paraburkholderia sp. NMBU_R16]
MTSLAKRVSIYRDALHFQSFRKLLIGQGLSMAGDAICLAALPIAIIRAGFGGETLGFILAAVGIGTVIGAVAGGMLADRRSPKRVLIATDIARGTAQLMVVALIASGCPSWSLVLAYLAFGIGIGVSRPCTQVLLVNLLPKQALVAGNGAINFIDNFVAVIFPATLGILIILWDPVWGVLIDGITFFAAAIFTALLPNETKLQSEDEFSIREALNGVAVVTRNPELLLGFAATVVVNVLCFPVFLVVAPYAVTERFSDAMWGVCLAASGLGACIGSIVTVLASGHRHLPLLTLGCGLFLGSAMALLGMGGFAWMAVLGATFVGFVEASWLTGWATAMQTLSPEKDLGKVVAVDTLITSGAHPFIYLGGGLVGEAVGYSHALIIAAVISTIGTVTIGLLTTSRKRRGKAK